MEVPFQIMQLKEKKSFPQNSSFLLVFSLSFHFFPMVLISFVPLIATDIPYTKVFYLNYAILVRMLLSSNLIYSLDQL